MSIITCVFRGPLVKTPGRSQVSFVGAVQNPEAAIFFFIMIFPFVTFFPHIIIIVISELLPNCSALSR